MEAPCPSSPLCPYNPDSLRDSAEYRKNWPFLRELEIVSPSEVRALTHARSDLTRWLHVPEQVRMFALLVERLLRPGERVMVLPEITFKRPLTTQARLKAERVPPEGLVLPPNIASTAEFATNLGKNILVSAVPDPAHPLPPEFGTSGSFAAGPSIKGFKWGAPSQILVPTPGSLLPYIETDGDQLDAAHVLLMNAARRAPFAKAPALLFVTAVHDFELPSDNLLADGGRIDCSFDPAECRTTQKGFTVYTVQSDFVDQQGRKDGGARFTFAMTNDPALAAHFSAPCPRLK